MIYGWHDNDLYAFNIVVDNDLTIKGTLTFGDAATDTLTIKGRMSSMTAAGSAIQITSAYVYGEGIEMRYQVTDWTGVGSAFKGMYLRSEAITTAASGKSIYGAEIYGVCNNVTMTTGSLWGALFYSYVKGVDAVTVNNMYAVQGELTWDASRTGDCTITTAAACFRAKITGGRVADYTKIHGYELTIGEMDGDSAKFGKGLFMQDDSGMSGTCTLTTGIDIAIGCTTGISIGGTCSTAGLFLGTTNKISFHDSNIYMRASADGHFEIVSDDTITLSVPGSGHGGIVFGGETDWGTGATGPDLDGTGWDWVTQTVGRISSADITAAAYAAAYHAFTVGEDQGNSTSVFGTWTELYIKNSVDLSGADNFAAVWGQFEAGTSVTLADTGCFTAGGYFNVKAGSTLTVASGHSVNGVRAQLEVSAISNAGTLAAFQALVNDTIEWAYGLHLASCTTGMYMSDVGAAGEHFIDMADAYLGMVIETGTYQSSADGGITLSDSNTRPVSFLFDDSGSALTGNNRAVLSRVYLAESQAAGATIVSIQGQLKLADTKNLGAGRWSAMDAYLEFEGTSSLTTGGYTSALDVRIDVAATETVTVDSGAILAGIHIQTTGTGTLTQTGSCYGIYINDQGTIDDWKVGISINNSTTGVEIGACTTGISFTGDHSGSCIVMGTSGVPLSSSTEEHKFIDCRYTATGKNIFGWYLSISQTYATDGAPRGLTIRTSLDHTSGHTVQGANSIDARVTLGATNTGIAGEMHAMESQLKVDADTRSLNGTYAAHKFTNYIKDGNTMPATTFFLRFVDQNGASVATPMMFDFSGLTANAANCIVADTGAVPDSTYYLRVKCPDDSIGYIPICGGMS